MNLLRHRVTPATVVAADKLKRLGTIGGDTYLEHAGDEYRLSGPSSSTGNDLGADGSLGHLIVATPITADNGDGRRIIVGSSFRVAVPVAKGTYQAAVERGVRRRPSTARVRSLPDALSGITMLDPKRDFILAQTAARPGPPDAKPSGYVAGRGPVRGDAILPAVSARGGAEIVVRAGRPVAVPLPGQRINADVVLLLDRAARLVVALVTHEGTCELDHGKDTPPPPWTELPGGALACEAHARGDLRP